MVSITQVPAQGQNNGIKDAASVPGSDSNFVIGGSGTTPITYVFDAVFELEHEQRLEKTRHPVQSGTDVSSHAYLQAARCVMFIGMSDSMDSYSSGENNANVIGNVSPTTVTPFTGTSSSKSVNAYQTLLQLQSARQPLTITTRLRTYTNMLVAGVSPREDHKTIAGLKCRVEFEQIIMAFTSVGPVVSSGDSVLGDSARPDTTTTTGLGQVNPSAVTKIAQQQFGYPPAEPIKGFFYPGGAQAFYAPAVSVPETVSIPGAGAYSSVAGQAAINALGAVIP